MCKSHKQTRTVQFTIFRIKKQLSKIILFEFFVLVHNHKSIIRIYIFNANFIIILINVDITRWLKDSLFFAKIIRVLYSTDIKIFALLNIDVEYNEIGMLLMLYRTHHATFKNRNFPR